MSIFRTGVLLAGLTALFLVVGYLIGGEAGMLIALGFAVMTNMFAYFSGDKVVLRMYGAREVDRRSAPGFYGIVEQLARQGRPADAPGLHDRERPAERVCDRDAAPRRPASR